MDSGIQEFFKNKTVFLTGGSGYLGKVVTEKLLRTTEVKRIYTLIRPKRGVSIGERITAWEQDPIFEVLLKARPEALHRICPIAGDCLSPDLDISGADRELLVSEVQVVIHGAATVRFDEPLHVATAINVRATRLMLQLAKQMTQLVSYVHISTAYSNCVVSKIDERFYPENLSCSSDKILAIANILGNETLNSLTSSLIGSFPNTYAYTKALSEDVIRREAGDLPVCIFRPAIIMPTYKDPVVGWMDNLYGPMALLFGAARGVVRAVIMDSKAMIGMVPADYCGNATLACAWKTGQESVKRDEAKNPPIYTLAPSEKNLISFGTYISTTTPLRHQTPLSKMIWYPYLLGFPPSIFPLVAFFYHTLPGYFVDALLLLMGRKPILTKMYRKIHKNVGLLTPFTCTSFHFETTNTQRLLETMSKYDRSIYDFDMACLDWTDFLKCALYGLRKYVAKDTDDAESIAKALNIKNRFMVLHYVSVICLVSAVAYGLWILAKLIIV